MGGSVVERIAAGKQLSAGCGTHRCGMKVREPNAFAMEGIEVGRFQYRVAVTGQIPIALVVSHHKNNVRFSAACSDTHNVHPQEEQKQTAGDESR